MNPDTLKALKDSIAHWERIVAGKEESAGSDNCALCQHFPGLGPSECVRESDSGEIELCPVASKTGYVDCSGSPYYSFVSASRKEAFEQHLVISNYAVYGPASLADAKAELAFLQSLLPEEKSNEQV
jgi:hypothetical protein